MNFCERKFVKTMQTPVSFKANALFWLKNVQYLFINTHFPVGISAFYSITEHELI